MTHPLTRRKLLQTSAMSLGALSIPGAASAMTGGRTLMAGGNGSAVGSLQKALVYPRTRADLAALARFDDTHMVTPDGGVEVLLWPGDIDRLADSGLRHRITVTDVVAEDAARREAAAGIAIRTDVPGARQDYRMMEDYNADLRFLAANYPHITRLFEMPLKTLEGRTVLGIEISSTAGQLDGKPAFYMDGIHHAREWPAGEFTMMWAFDLCENYGKEARVTRLVDGLHSYIVPIVNVDGFIASRTSAVNPQNSTQSLPFAATGTVAYQRKNQRGVNGPGASAAYGVDPNRNYGFHWGGEGASPLPVDQTHYGTSAFSEPESTNVALLNLGIHPITSITNHTFSNLVLRPWGDVTTPTPDEAILADLGARMSAETGYRNQLSIELYPTTGTTQDWLYGALGSLSYTFEIGNINFHPPYAQVARDAKPGSATQGALISLPELYLQNAQSYRIAAEAALERSNQAVITGRLVDAAGSGVQGSFEVTKDFAAKSANLAIEVPLINPAFLEQFGIPSGVVTPYEWPSHQTRRVTRVVTGADGAFSFTVTPSALPLNELGDDGAYDVVGVSAGRASAPAKVTVERGGTAELGDIVVS